MRVLIACEFSGVVREAFRRRGHEVCSCDLLPSEDASSFHVIENAEKVAYRGQFDLMIAHPPCTYLCNSGVKHLYIGGKRENGPDEKRWAEMLEAARFFRALLDAPIPRICLENPIMHWQARQPIGWKYSQIIQPWQFGHGETKATCLWLKGLPKLQPTQIVEGRRPRVHYASPGPDRWKERSRTLPGIAEAMAEQWG